MKEKIKRMMFTVVLVVITIILSTILSVYATTTIILGSEVSYDNTKHPALNASNVQAAIDNTYSSALSLDTRVSALERQSVSVTAKVGTLATNGSFKIGNSYFLNFKIIGVTAAIGTGKFVVIATVPNPPPEEISLVVVCSNSLNYIGWLRINGEVVITGSTSMSNDEVRVVSVY